MKNEPWTVDKVGELISPLAYNNAQGEWCAGTIGDMPVTEELQAVADKLNAATVPTGWRTMDSAPTTRLILLAVTNGNDRRTFVAEASFTDGELSWLTTTGWTGWSKLHRSWRTVAWANLPEHAM